MNQRLKINLIGSLKFQNFCFLKFQNFCFEVLQVDIIKEY